MTNCNRDVSVQNVSVYIKLLAISIRISKLPKFIT